MTVDRPRFAEQVPVRHDRRSVPPVFPVGQFAFSASVDRERLASLQQCEPVDPNHLPARRPMMAAKANGDGTLLVMHCTRGGGEVYLEPVDAYTVVVVHDACDTVDSWTPSGGFASGRTISGDAVMIPVGEAAYIKLGNPSSVTFVFVRPSLLFKGLREEPPGAPPPMAARTGARDALLRCLAYGLADEATQASSGRASVIETAGAALAAHLLAHYRDRSQVGGGPLSQQQQDLVREYVSARLDREVRLDDLAEVTGYSTSHFAHLFKATLGMPPMRYVQQLKMQRARELIESTVQPIAEVGIRVGYDDPAHFSRTFRSYWRVSPSSLRRLGA